MTPKQAEAIERAVRAWMDEHAERILREVLVPRDALRAQKEARLREKEERLRERETRLRGGKKK